MYAIAIETSKGKTGYFPVLFNDGDQAELEAEAMEKYENIRSATVTLWVSTKGPELFPVG